MWSRAVWLEGDVEEEYVVPYIWIKGDHLYWPPGADARKAIQECRAPSSTWRSFPLVKVKITSESHAECEEFEETTTVESSENEEDIPTKRKKKKKLFDDFETREVKDGLPLPPTKFKVNSRPSIASHRRKSPRKASLPQSPSRSNSRSRLSPMTPHKKPNEIMIPKSPVVSSKRPSASRKGLNTPSRSPSHSPVRSPKRQTCHKSPVTSPKRPTRHRSRSPVTSPKGPTYRSPSTASTERPSTPHRSKFPVTSPKRPTRHRSRSPVRSPKRPTYRSPSTASTERPSTPHRSPSRSRSPVEFYPRPSSTSGKSIPPRSESPVIDAFNKLCSTLSKRRTPSRSRSKSPVHQHPRSRSPRSKSPVYKHPWTRSPRSKWPVASSTPSTSGSQSRRQKTPSGSPPRQSVNRSKMPSTSSDSSYPMTEARFQKRVIYLLCEIRNLVAKGQPAAGWNVEEDEMAPAETLQDFEHLEDGLKTVETRLKMIQALSAVGGVSMRDNMKRMMERVMSIRLMAEFNMLGNIKACVTKNFKGTEQEFDKCLSNLLKYAPDRKGGAGRKKD